MINNVTISSSNTELLKAKIQAAVTTIIFCNTGSSEDTLSVYVVKNGGTPNSSNTIISNLKVVNDDTFVFDTEKLILEKGDSVVAKSNNGTISATISVMELA